MYSMYGIRRVSNGYILDMAGKGEMVFTSLDSLFDHLRVMFEGGLTLLKPDQGYAPESHGHEQSD